MKWINKFMLTLGLVIPSLHLYAVQSGIPPVPPLYLAIYESARKGNEAETEFYLSSLEQEKPKIQKTILQNIIDQIICNPNEEITSQQRIFLANQEIIKKHIQATNPEIMDKVLQKQKWTVASDLLTCGYFPQTPTGRNLFYNIPHLSSE